MLECCERRLCQGASQTFLFQDMRGSKKTVVIETWGMKLTWSRSLVKNVRCSGVKLSALCLSLVVGPGVSCIGMGRFSWRAWEAGAGAAADAPGADTTAVPPEIWSRLSVETC